MSDNQRYITRGIDAEIPLWLQIFMWECVDRMTEPKDYFQVFELNSLGGMQRIIHFSEQPEYRMNYFIPTNKALTAKVYIIDSDEYSTMLLASEIEDMLMDYDLLHTTIQNIKCQDYYDDFLCEM